jgi:hypothetical protein
MAVSEASVGHGANLAVGDLRSVTRDYVDHLCAGGSRFLRWEREHILKRAPSAKDQEEHRQTLKWLIRVTRLVHSLAADPEFPDPAAKGLLEGVIWQLEESWKAIYDQMPAEEADKLLADVFPNGSGA